MTKGEAINWLINISADIGKLEHKELWHYEQALFEIREMLEAQPEIIRCKDCKHLYEDNKCPLRTWWTHTEDDYCSYAERRQDV